MPSTASSSFRNLLCKLKPGNTSVVTDMPDCLLSINEQVESMMNEVWYISGGNLNIIGGKIFFASGQGVQHVTAKIVFIPRTEKCTRAYNERIRINIHDHSFCLRFTSAIRIQRRWRITFNIGLHLKTIEHQVC